MRTFFVFSAVRFLPVLFLAAAVVSSSAVSATETCEHANTYCTSVSHCVLVGQFCTYGGWNPHCAYYAQDPKCLAACSQQLRKCEISAKAQGIKPGVDPRANVSAGTRNPAGAAGRASIAAPPGSLLAGDSPTGAPSGPARTPAGAQSIKGSMPPSGPLQAR